MSNGKTYDLVVIGSWTAAQVASYRERAVGWSAAVIDHLPFGETCALRGWLCAVGHCSSSALEQKNAMDNWTGGPRHVVSISLHGAAAITRRRYVLGALPNFNVCFGRSRPRHGGASG